MLIFSIVIERHSYNLKINLLKEKRISKDKCDFYNASDFKELQKPH